jgi:hypothetical protein
MNPRPPINLNAIVKTVHDCQRVGNGETFQPVETIHVDRNGRLIHGKDYGATQSESLSTVQPDTFHSGREEAERRIVETKMPTNTRMVVSREGVRGWLYSFQTEYLDTYIMFAYFDGSAYQVVIIKPQVEQRFCNSHTGHIYPDNRIDLGGAESALRWRMPTPSPCSGTMASVP